jgi:hypothetical protein
MSIGRAQAAAIAEGFLDQVGSGTSVGLRPKETFTEIVLLAAELIEDAQTLLNKSNSNASGKLSASLIASDPKLISEIFKVDVNMNFYGLFVNKGVKGIHSGSSLAGYSFKSDVPSRGFVEAIEAWKTRAAQSTRTINRKKTYGANETKNASIAALTGAYAIARGIMQKGLKPTGFMDGAAAATRKRVPDRLGNAVKIDITNSLTQ